MAKTKTRFVCSNCGAAYPKWTGRCENCGEWNTLTEEMVETGSSIVAKSTIDGTVLKPQSIGTIESQELSSRLDTGFADLNLVLGGGVLPGGVMLVAGQPGIGKSTLLLQVAANIASKDPVLYISGEESAHQVKLRAERLGADASDALEFVSSTNANDIGATIREGGHKLIIIDSIQTLSLNDITSAPGTVSQITNSSNVIIRAAKQSGAAVILVGHVTKEGSPKIHYFFKGSGQDIVDAQPSKAERGGSSKKKIKGVKGKVKTKTVFSALPDTVQTFIKANYLNIIAVR